LHHTGIQQLTFSFNNHTRKLKFQRNTSTRDEHIGPLGQEDRGVVNDKHELALYVAEMIQLFPSIDLNASTSPSDLYGE